MFVPDDLEGESLDLKEILARQLSYFGPLPKELTSHIDDPLFCLQLVDLEGLFHDEGSRQPFQKWEEVPNLDQSAKDFLGGALQLDPAKRCTASDLAQHPWLNSR